MNSTDQPRFPLPDDSNANPAADLVRAKLDSIYGHEPDAVSEAIESVREPAKERSRHQRKMYELATSGKPLAQIQTEWHEYYVGLNNKDKHEVWQEFYANAKQATMPSFAQNIPEPPKPEFAEPSRPRLPSQIIAEFEQPKPTSKRPESVAELKQQILGKVRTRGTGKLSRRQHFQSLAFGLATGSLVILILLFGFFNERFIAPFITPSRTVSASPLILGDESTIGNDPKVIIPKINVELPVVYDVGTIDESAVEEGLERGVVHYATTSNPGEKGNTVIFGHSSNNILNKGKYKFAFVLLSRLEIGDTFYLEKDGKRFVYKIFDKKIVKPEQVDVLNPVDGHTATATLITCDPPGTSINRLIVVADQITPDPNANTDSTALKTDLKPQKLASNSESLWHRIWHGIF